MMDTLQDLVRLYGQGDLRGWTAIVMDIVWKALWKLLSQRLRGPPSP